MFKRKNNLFLFVLIVFFAYLLQFKTLIFFNFSPSFLIATFVVLAFLADYFEFLFLSLFGIFLINFKPGFNFEIILFFLILQLAYFVLKIFHFENWFALLILLISSIFLFYGFLNYHFILDYPIYFIYDILISFIFALILFWSLKDKKIL
jgi:hypothetical protein